MIERIIRNIWIIKIKIVHLQHNKNNNEKKNSYKIVKKNIKKIRY
jgi:hypothetical protein